MLWGGSTGWQQWRGRALVVCMHIYARNGMEWKKYYQALGRFNHEQAIPFPFGSCSTIFQYCKNLQQAASAWTLHGVVAAGSMAKIYVPFMIPPGPVLRSGRSWLWLEDTCVEPCSASFVLLFNAKSFVAESEPPRTNPSKLRCMENELDPIDRPSVWGGVSVWGHDVAKQGKTLSMHFWHNFSTSTPLSHKGVPKETANSELIAYIAVRWNSCCNLRVCGCCTTKKYALFTDRSPLSLSQTAGRGWCGRQTCGSW